MLEEDPEAFADALGIDEGFEVEAGADADGLIDTGVEEIGEFIALSQSEKKLGLGNKA